MRQHFGYGRYDNPAVTPLINTLCREALEPLLNHFLPTLKLEGKQRVGSRVVRQYGPPQTPLARVLAAVEVSAETQACSRAMDAMLNPFQPGRDLERHRRVIEARRLPSFSNEGSNGSPLG